MPNPEELAPQAISFQIRPGPYGLGYEIQITRHVGTVICRAHTLDQVLEHFVAHVDDFFSIDAIVDADPDVAGHCCPACEDSLLERP